MTDSIDVSAWPAPLEGEDHEQLKIMLAGRPYIAVDKYLCRIREDMATKMFEYNAERSGDKRQELLAAMATLRNPEGKAQNTHIMPPFTFEYVSFFQLARVVADEQGFNLNLGTDIYVGPNGQFIDVNESTFCFLPIHKSRARTKANK